MYFSATLPLMTSVVRFTDFVFISRLCPSTEVLGYFQIVRSADD